MAKIMIDNDLIINTDELEECYRHEKTIYFAYKSGERRSYHWESKKEAQCIFGKIANLMLIPEENKIEVFV